MWGKRTTAIFQVVVCLDLHNHPWDKAEDKTKQTETKNETQNKTNKPGAQAFNEGCQILTFIHK